MNVKHGNFRFVFRHYTCGRDHSFYSCRGYSHAVTDNQNSDGCNFSLIIHDTKSIVFRLVHARVNPRPTIIMHNHNRVLFTVGFNWAIFVLDDEMTILQKFIWLRKVCNFWKQSPIKCLFKILFFGSHVWFLISKSLPFEEELSPSVSNSIISYLFNLVNILWRQIVTGGCKPSINGISLNRFCIIIADHSGYPNSNYLPFGILARNPRNQVFHD